MGGKGGVASKPGAGALALLDVCSGQGQGREIPVGSEVSDARERADARRSETEGLPERSGFQTRVVGLKIRTGIAEKR